MSPDRFEHLLSLVAPLTSRQTTPFRKPISAEQRLAVTLRYLATSETQQSLSFGYQIGKATMRKILAGTSEAIFQTLKDQFLKTPNCQKKWLSIPKGFENKWNFPRCLGSLDVFKITTTVLKYRSMFQLIQSIIANHLTI